MPREEDGAFQLGQHVAGAADPLAGEIEVPAHRLQLRERETARAPRCGGRPPTPRRSARSWRLPRAPASARTGRPGQGGGNVTPLLTHVARGACVVDRPLHGRRSIPVAAGDAVDGADHPPCLGQPRLVVVLLEHRDRAVGLGERALAPVRSAAVEFAPASAPVRRLRPAGDRPSRRPPTSRRPAQPLGLGELADVQQRLAEVGEAAPIRRSSKSGEQVGGAAQQVGRRGHVAAGKGAAVRRMPAGWPRGCPRRSRARRSGPSSGQERWRLLEVVPEDLLVLLHPRSPLTRSAQATTRS